MIFVKLTLSSNGLPTYINVEAIHQIYEDTDNKGNDCTRIEFSNDYTKVSESMKFVILEIAKAKLNSQYGHIGDFIVTPISMKAESEDEWK